MVGVIPDIAIAPSASICTSCEGGGDDAFNTLLGSCASGPAVVAKAVGLSLNSGII